MTDLTKANCCLVLSGHCLDTVSEYFENLGWRKISGLPQPEYQDDHDQLLGVWQAPGGASVELVRDGWIHWLAFREATDSVIEAAGQALPTYDLAAVASLLTCDSTFKVMTGIRAAGVLADSRLAAPLASLRQHPHEPIRIEAASVLQAIVPQLFEQGMELLRERRRETRGANPLWDLLQPAWFRRQTLRWLLRDYSSTHEIEATLKAALSDPDWEVRCGALIGAVRHQFRSLVGLVEALPLPKVSRDGPNAPERAALRALKHVACALLAGRLPPVLGPDASPTSRALFRLAQWLSSESPTPVDSSDLLFFSLTTPVEPGTGTFPLPPGVTEDEAGPHLNGLRFATVPRVSAWIGGEDTTTIRQVCGGRFLIAEQPIAFGSEPAIMDGAEAIEWCRGTKGRLRLPTVEEWEFAARGTDGRRFPWGNGFQTDCLISPGPWGTWGHCALPEWATAVDGSLQKCGPRCAQCQRGDGVAHLRPVVEYQS